VRIGSFLLDRKAGLDFNNIGWILAGRVCCEDGILGDKGLEASGIGVLGIGIGDCFSLVGRIENWLLQCVILSNGTGLSYVKSVWNG
jgi:hypothetical protein